MFHHFDKYVATHQACSTRVWNMQISFKSGAKEWRSDRWWKCEWWKGTWKSSRMRRRLYMMRLMQWIGKSTPGIGWIVAKRRPVGDYYRAIICEGGLGSRNSVYPSVCLSVTRVDGDKTKWRTADILIPHSATLTPTVVGGRYSLPSEICAQSDPPPFEKRRLRQISAYNVWTIRGSEKSSIMTNIKSTTSFPTSYRWNAYVIRKSPKGWLKKRCFRFFE